VANQQEVNKSIKNSNGMWLHRRSFAYTFLLSFLFVGVYVIIFMPLERIAPSREIVCFFLGGCVLIVALYFLLTTLHDKTLLPLLKQIFQK